MKQIIERAYLTGERALFGVRDHEIVDTVFDDGESPLKECRDVTLRSCMLKWKYPLWYGENIEVTDSTWFEMARAGVWYSNHVRVENCAIEAPKNFRRCRDLSLRQVSFANAAETLWNCTDVTLEHVTAKGDYFAMNCRNLTVDGMTLYGNYSFDGCRDLTVKNSRLLSKDAFWNCENVRVENCTISGEYLGWNAKHLTLINCTIESLQGLCYVEDLVMRGCKLLNTTLALEYSTVDAEIIGHVDSIKNPRAGRIVVGSVGELTVDPTCVDPDKTEITVLEAVRT